MPYKKASGKIELARSVGHVPVVENPVIRESLRNFRVFHPSEQKELDQSLLVPAGSGNVQPDRKVQWVISFDGSPQEVSVREQYPSTRVGYIQLQVSLFTSDV